MPIRKSDYENYDYREFWEDDKRYYEDQSERIALRSMLRGVDPSNKLFIDIGCGYARLFNEYSNFQRVVLIDYSIKNLRNARERISRFLSDDPDKLSNVLFVSADATAIPVQDDSADTVLTVRVVHHLNKPEKYFDEVKRILKDGSLYLFEFANKRNLKNILRFVIGKMDTSPFGPVPLQIGETIRNYHAFRMKPVSTILLKWKFPKFFNPIPHNNLQQSPTPKTNIFHTKHAGPCINGGRAYSPLRKEIPQCREAK